MVKISVTQSVSWRKQSWHFGDMWEIWELSWSCGEWGRSYKQKYKTQFRKRAMQNAGLTEFKYLIKKKSWMLRMRYFQPCFVFSICNILSKFLIKFLTLSFIGVTLHFCMYNHESNFQMSSRTKLITEKIHNDEN